MKKLKRKILFTFIGILMAICVSSMVIIAFASNSGNTTQNDISLATIEGFSEEINISKDNTQEPILILNGQQLELNIDYKVFCFNNVYPGTAKMLIIGIGNYTGYVEKEYSITGSYNINIGESVRLCSMIPVKINISGSFNEAEILYDQEVFLTFDSVTEIEDFFSKSYLYTPKSGDLDGEACWSVKLYETVTRSEWYWNGKYYIKRSVKHKNLVGESKITALHSPVTKLSWSEMEPIVQKDKIFIQPVVYPVHSYDQELTWNSSDESIATVDDFGVVTILRTGDCTITVKTTEGICLKQELSIEPMDISKMASAVCLKDAFDNYTFTVNDKYGVMKKGVDYEVSYIIRDNIIHATFNGIGLYDGTLIKYFDITNNLKEISREELPYEIGDLNCDNKIDTADAVLLAQHLAGWSVKIEDSAADCNGDGRIDTADAVLLAQHLAGWSVTLG